MNRPTCRTFALGSILLAAFAFGCDDATTAPPAPRRIEVSVGASGYEPSRIEVDAHAPLVLAFRRTTDEGCGQELVIASQNVNVPLPLNETVEIELTPHEEGELRFTCGMDMYDGALVVRGVDG